MVFVPGCLYVYNFAGPKITLVFILDSYLYLDTYFIYLFSNDAFSNEHLASKVFHLCILLDY